MMVNEVRLIDANALLKKKREMELCFAVTEWDIENAPTIDPDSLRPKGRWEECDWVEYDGHDECVHYPHKGCACTNCRNAFKKEFVHNPRVEYCPHCGAKMEG